MPQTFQHFPIFACGVCLAFAVSNLIMQHTACLGALAAPLVTDVLINMIPRL